MDRYRYLLKNIGLLTISQFGTKLLSFFLVPLYTNVLTTTEYGTYDLFNTTVSLLIPILTLNIVDASLRFALDKNTDPCAVFSISIQYILKGSVLIFLISALNHLFKINTVLDQYWYFFILMFVLSALGGVVSYFARGIERVADVSISGLLTSAVMIGLNILFLLPLHMGISGYFLATIIGSFAGTFYLIIRIKAWHYFQLGRPNAQLKKEMLSYSKPLIANSIAWWINNASDRYIVIWLCGLAANGIYSVGYKIPSILNIFQTIFNQAWTLSAVKDFDPEDTDGFFSQMYNLYNFGMVFICSVLIVSTRWIAKILYAKDFYAAWKYVPFLMIAIVFGSLSGYIGGIFSAVKQSKIFAQSTVIGAISNIIMNLCFVYFLGPMGAAAATAISFWLVWAIRVKHLKKYIHLKMYPGRDYLAYGLLMIQSVLLLLFQTEPIRLYLGEIALTIALMLLFKREIRTAYASLQSKFKK